MRTRLAALPLSLLATVAAAACGSAPAAPAAPSTPSAASATAPAKNASSDKDDPAKKAAALERLTVDESKSGKCDPEHEAALNKLLADVEAAMKSRTDDDGKKLDMTVVGKRVVALGSSPRGVEMSVTGRGTELHVIAYAVKDVSMDVLAGTTAATTMRSPHARAIPNLALDLPNVGRVTEIAGDSRQVVIKPGQPLQVKLTGQGCAALISFLKPS
jgi:hypothetical protein